jgi:hypothetical protein
VTAQHSSKLKTKDGQFVEIDRKRNEGKCVLNCLTEGIVHIHTVRRSPFKHGQINGKI